jgi:hypothetical protein
MYTGAEMRYCNNAHVLEICTGGQTTLHISSTTDIQLLHCSKIPFQWKYVHSIVVGCGTTLQVGRTGGSIPNEVIGIFNWPNPSSHTMALGSTQPLT